MMPRVLILDPSLTIRMDLHDVFAAAGYQPTAVGTVEEARHAMAELPYGLLVSDAAPPSLDYLAELQANPATARVQALLLATEAEVQARAPHRTLTAADFIGKPYDRERVLAWARQYHAVAATGDGRPLVLVIDDSATLRFALRESLEAAGYDVALADSGETGLRVAESIRPDLFIIDGQLPGISGAMVIHRIRMDVALRRIPCLLLTASEEASDELGALEAGADAYARKSEGTGLILARANALLRAKPAPDAFDRVRTANRILAVDDSPTYLESLADELGAEGYELLLAASGEKALPILEKETVDAILLDMRMPDMSGADLCRLIKARPDWRDIPLAILSAADQPNDVIDGLNAGADDYIVKSEDFDVLKGRLRAQLRRKHFEDENRHIREEVLLKERAEAVTLAKSQFLATMSHEIRTPMNAVLGVADLLAATSLDNQQRSYVDLLKRSGENLLTIINDILDLSKIEAGRVELEQTAFKLSELVQQTVALAAIKAEEKHLQLSWHIEPGTPDDLVGDPHRLVQIFNNLLANAIKFTQAGTVTMEVGPDPDQPLPGALRFSVSDTGVGIPVGQEVAIFDAFTQADVGSSRVDLQACKLEYSIVSPK